MYPDLIQKIKISHGFRLSENIKPFNAQTPAFFDLKLSNLVSLLQYPILPLFNCNFEIITIGETDSLLEDIFLIANLMSFMIEAKTSKKKMRQGIY